MRLQTTNYARIDAAKRGDPLQLQSFVEVHQPVIVGYAVKHGGLEPADAEDLAQQFCAMLIRRGLLSYRQELGPFRPWFFRCLDNAIKNYHKRQIPADQGSGLTAIKLQLAQTPARHSDLDELCDAEALKWAMAKAVVAIGKHGERNRSIFLRMYLYDEGAATVAAEFELSPDSIYTICRDFKRHLSRLLEPLYCFT